MNNGGWVKVFMKNVTVSSWSEDMKIKETESQEREEGPCKVSRGYGCGTMENFSKRLWSKIIKWQESKTH